METIKLIEQIEIELIGEVSSIEDTDSKQSLTEEIDIVENLINEL